ncbi:flagellar basal body rod protein FlgB [Halobacillus sp. Marseille-Q1614]|uniref:flagellar basal body rod protein FlgB n=1 Tax=Halobacillus sp. Marseille-Q1614 TaxID=2709134 RepID=UPI00353014A4
MCEKNKVISANITNVDTIGYKAKQVTFKNVLSGELNSLEAKRTHPKHFTFENSSSPVIQTTSRQGTIYNHNGNNVDIDKELNELAKNQIQYQALVERLSGKFNSLKEVVRGGN